jgi:hypothetical protein
VRCFIKKKKGKRAFSGCKKGRKRDFALFQLVDKKGKNEVFPSLWLTIEKQRADFHGLICRLFGPNPFVLEGDNRL